MSAEPAQQISGDERRTMMAWVANLPWPVQVVLGTLLGAALTLILVSTLAQVPLGQIVQRVADMQIAEAQAEIEYRDRNRATHAAERADALGIMRELIGDLRAREGEIAGSLRAQAEAVTRIEREVLPRLEALEAAGRGWDSTLDEHGRRIEALEGRVRAICVGHPADCARVDPRTQHPP